MFNILEYDRKDLLTSVISPKLSDSASLSVSSQDNGIDDNLKIGSQ